MNIRRLEVLLKTVDLGSLTKASQVMGYTQSAISHIIADIELELGLKLLVRGRSGCYLTEEGKYLLPTIRTICQDNQKLFDQVSELKGLEQGTIRIGSILSVSIHMLPGIIHSFSEQHPNIEFEILQGSYEDIAQWIGEHRIDCGFLRTPTPVGMESFSLMKEKFLGIFPPNWDLGEGPFPFERVKDVSYILRPDTLDGELSKLLHKANCRPKITYSAKDDYAIMAMVEQGLGMSILAELLMKDASYHIQKRELSPPVFREICVAYHSESNLSPAARQFIRHIRNLYPPTEPQIAI